LSACPPDHLGGQRDVGGDHQVADGVPEHDAVVGHVEALRHLQRADVLEAARSIWLAISVAAWRSAARNRISLITMGQASASTQICIADSLP
jgi:hypothetical protein